MPANVFTRRVPEKKAEKKVNAWYDLLFPLLRTKLNLQGRKGWPDQAYWIPGGRPVLFEYKAEGEAPRKLQGHIHTELEKHGYIVEVHHDAAEAIASLKRHMALAQARSVAEAVTSRVDAALGKAGATLEALAEEAGRRPARKAGKAREVEASPLPGQGREVCLGAGRGRAVPEAGPGEDDHLVRGDEAAEEGGPDGPRPRHRAAKARVPGVAGGGGQVGGLRGLQRGRAPRK
jgi:hypothetical protein